MTMVPPVSDLCCISGRNARMVLKWAIRLTLKFRWTSAAESCRSGLPFTIPALLMRMVGTLLNWEGLTVSCEP